MVGWEGAGAARHLVTLGLTSANSSSEDRVAASPTAYMYSVGLDGSLLAAIYRLNRQAPPTRPAPPSEPPLPEPALPSKPSVADRFWKPVLAKAWKNWVKAVRRIAKELEAAENDVEREKRLDDQISRLAERNFTRSAAGRRMSPENRAGAIHVTIDAALGTYSEIHDAEVEGKRIEQLQTIAGLKSVGRDAIFGQRIDAAAGLRELIQVSGRFGSLVNQAPDLDESRLPQILAARDLASCVADQVQNAVPTVAHH